MRPRGQGGGGADKCGQVWKRGRDGGSKLLKMYEHPLWMAP